MTKTLLALKLLLASLLFALPAMAQDDAFTVSGIPIDATAANSTLAREQAIAAGAPRALRQLMQNLAPEDQRDRVPTLSSGVATSLAVGFRMDDELRSATRYRANMTVSFEPEGVRRLLRDYGIAFVESAAPPTLVIPVYIVGGRASLFTANPWREGWDEGRYINGFAPVVLPSAFGSQASQANADALAGGDIDALASMARSYGVDRVLLAAAQPQGDTLAVDLTLVTLDTGAADTLPLGTVTVRSGESPTPFVLAADRTHEALENQWKERTIIRSNTRTEMRLTVLYDTINEWHALRNNIGGSPFVTDVRLDAMSRDGAYMTLVYRGVREQLSSDLLRRGVALRTDPRLGEVAANASQTSVFDQPAAASTVSVAPVSAPPPAAVITPRAGMSADEVLRSGTAAGVQ